MTAGDNVLHSLARPHSLSWHPPSFSLYSFPHAPDLTFLKICLLALGGPIIDDMSIAGRKSLTVALACTRLTVDYAGPTIKLRRGKDSVELDFFADFSGNMFSSVGATVQEWIGPEGVAFVVTLFDQSGNGKHATQPTQDCQPRYVPRKKCMYFTAGSFLALDPSCLSSSSNQYSVTVKHGLLASMVDESTAVGFVRFFGGRSGGGSGAAPSSYSLGYNKASYCGTEMAFGTPKSDNVITEICSNDHRSGFVNSAMQWRQSTRRLPKSFTKAFLGAGWTEGDDDIQESPAPSGSNSGGGWRGGGGGGGESSNAAVEHFLDSVAALMMRIESGSESAEVIRHSVHETIELLRAATEQPQRSGGLLVAMMHAMQSSLMDLRTKISAGGQSLAAPCRRIRSIEGDIRRHVSRAGVLGPGDSSGRGRGGLFSPGAPLPYRRESARRVVRVEPEDITRHLRILLEPMGLDEDTYRVILDPETCQSIDAGARQAAEREAVERTKSEAQADVGRGFATFGSVARSRQHAHELAQCGLSRRETARCDVCGEQGSCAYYCGACDWDCCISCLSAEGPPLLPPPTAAGAAAGPGPQALPALTSAAPTSAATPAATGATTTDDIAAAANAAVATGEGIGTAGASASASSGPSSAVATALPATSPMDVAARATISTFIATADSVGSGHPTVGEGATGSMMRVRIHCHGFQLRIRPQPNTAEDAVGFFLDGETAVVFTEPVDGYYRLVDERVSQF